MKPGTIGALTGIAAAFGHFRRLSRDEALAELRDYLVKVPKNERQQALDEAAAMFVTTVYWHADALELLIAAGADRAAAESIRARRPGTNLGALGMLAAETAPEP